MLKSTPLSAIDLRNLKLVQEIWVSASYWEDETIRRYDIGGLVWSDGKRIRLTDAGRRASITSEPIGLYHPI